MNKKDLFSFLKATNDKMQDMKVFIDCLGL